MGTLPVLGMGLGNQEAPGGLAATVIPGPSNETFATRLPVQEAEGDLAERLDDPRFETADDPRIPPSQTRFKIGEVARIVGVKPYVLRYWEGEFPWVVPEKTDSGQRRYGRQDVAALLMVRRLRHDEKLSIARTRLLLEESRRTGCSVRLPGSTPPSTAPDPLGGVDGAFVRRHLAEIRRAAERLLKAVEE